MREDAKLKHLELIQGVISRMAGNLFFLKGWAITLIAALFALAAKDSNPKYIFIALMPVIVFWVLDGYFLAQERCYRALYEHVRKLKDDAIDFSMDVRPFSKKRPNRWIDAMFSGTLLIFYGSLVLIMGATSYLVNR